MKSAMEVGTKMKSAMELATEVEEANEMKTVMEVPTEWTSEEELWWNNNWIDLRGSWNDMCDGSSNSSEVRSEWIIHDTAATKMKFTLESRSGKLSEICAGVSTRTKYEMKSVI